MMIAIKAVSISITKLSPNPMPVVMIKSVSYTHLQLVITPVVIADFVLELSIERGTGAFGSTGQ